MRLCEALRIPRGVTAVVGGGGKTALIDRLCDELDGRVLRSTTTRIWPPKCQRLLSPTAEAVGAAFTRARVLAVGAPTAEGKWAEVAALRDSLPELADYVLLEADGSRGLPLKAPDEREPVVPECVALTVAVAGLSAVGRPIRDAAHRPERYARLVGADIHAPVTPAMIAAALEHPQGQRKGCRGRFAVLLNQADDEQRLAWGREIAARLTAEAWIVSLLGAPDRIEHWRNGACLS